MMKLKVANERPGGTAHWGRLFSQVRAVIGANEISF